MTRFSVDLDELNEVATDLEKFGKTVEQKLADLEQLVADLHLSWTGAAATAHHEAHQEWKAGAAQMHQGLADMHKAATTAHDNYHAAATSNADMWSQTR